MVKIDGSFSVDTLFLIVERDEHKCVRCGRSCGGERGRDWSVHHRKPRGMGGTSDPAIGGAANGIILCGSGTEGCHGEVEAKRKLAREQGFLISRNSVLQPVDVPIFHGWLGWVRLDNDGGVT